MPLRRIYYANTKKLSTSVSLIFNKTESKKEMFYVNGN